MVANVICNCWHCASLVVFVRVCRQRRRDARRSGHIGVLSSATAGRLERSDRCDRVLLPLGYERELRLPLVDGFTCWGARRSASQDPPTSRGGRGRCGIARLGASRRTSNRAGARCRLVDTTPEGPGLMIRDDELEIPPSRLTPSAGSKSFRMSGQDYRIRSGRSRPACGRWRMLTARRAKRRARGEGPVAGW